jgi:hypothetical protein
LLKYYFINIYSPKYFFNEKEVILDCKPLINILPLLKLEDLFIFCSISLDNCSNINVSEYVSNCSKFAIETRLFPLVTSISSLTFSGSAELVVALPIY